MAKGMSLHVGLNAVDPNHYSGWSGELVACEADAEDMAAIGQFRSFSTKLLLTAQATRKAVIAEIRRAAKALKSGDAFFLTYSGHGGQLPDQNGDEEDMQDETWCLYDGQMVDDELSELYGEFQPGVRIIVLSDSCHSGTVTKMAFYRGNVSALESPDAPRPRFRFMPPAVALRTYRDNRKFYDTILSNAKSSTTVSASVLLISGCQDNQLSADGTFNGKFTGTLLEVWMNGAFKGDYPTFRERIVARMPPDQTPNYYFVGAPDLVFEGQTPFTI